MSDDPKDLEEVQRRLDEIQVRKRGDIRWHMSRHTAERAIEAIAGPPPSDPGLVTRRAGTGKQRRRKRRKRLL